MIGLQQCVGAKNGTAISNPVLHRDCRSISGSADNQGNGPSGYAQNAPNSFGGPVPVFPNTGQASPATLTASPAPSGSSTPGPAPPQGGFPAPPNGPNASGPFGSPSNVNAPPFGRPSSSGPSFGTPHFGGPQFGMPSNSPFPHNHPMAQIGSHMMAGPPSMDQTALQSVPRRHNTFYNSTEFRVHELNKRLQQRTEDSDNLWWDSFATEFFEDDASLTVTFCLEDGPKRYTIGRTLIPRYFRSIFDGGVTELYFHLKLAKESFHNPTITLDCDQCTMVTHHLMKSMFTKVCTEGRLQLEFVYDDYMRIKSWHMAVRTHRELIPKSMIGMHTHPPQADPSILDQMSKNITRQGITNSTLNYLRLCVILEPMQELMSRHKAYSLNPRDCLKTTLFQKWQRMVAPPGKRDAQRPPNKRRKRKGSNSGSGANSAPPVPSKKRSPGPNFSLATQDVMVVGEPSLMGGEFGDEDERLITRLENTQYDAANSMDHDNHGGFGHDSPITGGPNSWNVDRSGPQGNTPSSQDSEKKSPAVSQ